jgi:acyl-coenzyme A thioesterase PaaI-like protein
MPMTITEGPYAGWMRWKLENDGRFSDKAIGQFHFRDEADGKVRCRIETGFEHTNGGNFIHGGMMMTYADMAYFAGCWRILENMFAVTLSATFEFVGAAKPGEPLDAVTEIIKETGKLIFVHTRIEQNGHIVATSSATLRKISRAVIKESGMRTEG